MYSELMIAPQYAMQCMLKPNGRTICFSNNASLSQTTLLSEQKQNCSRSTAYSTASTAVPAAVLPQAWLHTWRCKGAGDRGVHVRAYLKYCNRRYSCSQGGILTQGVTVTLMTDLAAYQYLHDV